MTAAKDRMVDDLCLVVREPGHEVIVDNSPGVVSEGKAVVSVRTQPSHEPDHEPDRGPDHEPEYE